VRETWVLQGISGEDAEFELAEEEVGCYESGWDVLVVPAPVVEELGRLECVVGVAREW
jgi:hypothetical protein